MAFRLGRATDGRSTQFTLVKVLDNLDDFFISESDFACEDLMDSSRGGWMRGEYSGSSGLDSVSDSTMLRERILRIIGVNRSGPQPAAIREEFPTTDRRGTRHSGTRITLAQTGHCRCPLSATRLAL